MCLEVARFVVTDNSIPTVVKDTQQDWEKILRESGLSMSRGFNNKRIHYGSSDAVRTEEISWDDAAIWIPRKRKAHKPHKTVDKVCECCSQGFIAKRIDAKTCSVVCRKRKERSVTDKYIPTNERQ